MSLVLDLDPKLLEASKKQAATRGLTVESYIQELIEKDVIVDELLAPVRKQFAESRMTEDELDEFFEGVREKAFKERYPHGRP